MKPSFDTVVLALRTWEEYAKNADADPDWCLPDDFFTEEETLMDFSDEETYRAVYLLALLRNVEEGKIK